MKTPRSVLGTVSRELRWAKATRTVAKENNRAEKPIWLPSATAKCKTSAASAVLRASRLPTRPQSPTISPVRCTVLVRFHSAATLVDPHKDPWRKDGRDIFWTRTVVRKESKRTRWIDSHWFNIIPLEMLLSESRGSSFFSLLSARDAEVWTTESRWIAFCLKLQRFTWYVKRSRLMQLHQILYVASRFFCDRNIISYSLSGVLSVKIVILSWQHFL